MKMWNLIEVIKNCLHYSMKARENDVEKVKKKKEACK